MSNTFVNNSPAEMSLPGPNGTLATIAANGGVLTGVSNFYQRYIGKVQGFEQTVNDSSAWVDGEGAAGKVGHAATVNCAEDSDFADNEIVFANTVIGGPASFCQITVSVGPVVVKVNDGMEFTLATGVTQKFDNADLLITKLQFSVNDDDLDTATVDIIATGRPA